MNLGTLRLTLAAHSAASLRLVLPNGQSVPAEFHVTEVGHVKKSFIDCGGTARTTEACVLQVWVAKNDADHRLTAGRLASILNLSARIIPSEDLPVEVEYQGESITIYLLDLVHANASEICFSLCKKTTDCLAQDKCGIPASPAKTDNSCGCGPKGCC